MKLLQTRVDDEVAARFAKAAERRETSSYDLLAQLVADVAGQETVGGWDKHTFPEGRPAPVNAVVKAREGENR